MARWFVVVMHTPHCPSSLAFFLSEEDALGFNDPNGGTIEWTESAEHGRRPIGTWLECDPLTVTRVEGGAIAPTPPSEVR